MDSSESRGFSCHIEAKTTKSSQIKPPDLRDGTIVIN
jgi:hypothetical protein